MNVEEVSVEYMDLVDKRSVKYRQNWRQDDREADGTTENSNLLQLWDLQRGQTCDKVPEPKKI